MTPSGRGPDSAASIVDHRLLIKNSRQRVQNGNELGRDET